MQVAVIRYSVKTGALAMGVSESEFRKMIREGCFPAYRDGKKVYVLPKDLVLYNDLLVAKRSKAA